MVKAAEALKKLPLAQPADRYAICKQIEELEQQADVVTHKAFDELNSTFVTPFDREDIHLLTSTLDDIIDYMDGSAKRFILYKIQECPPAISELAEVVYKSALEIQRGIALLQDMKDIDVLNSVIRNVNEYENEADKIFDRAIEELFENEKDPIKLIKLKEVLVGLETATDKCEDVANVLETIMIKHA
mgnify:FL=1